MRRLIIATLVVGALAACAFSQPKGSPFAGRWDFNLTQDGTNRAAWLGITDKAGALTFGISPPAATCSS